MARPPCGGPALRAHAPRTVRAGRSNNQQGGTKEVGSGFNSFKNAVKEGAEQVRARRTLTGSCKARRSLWAMFKCSTGQALQGDAGFGEKPCSIGWAALTGGADRRGACAQASPESIGDKLREAIPGLSELPSAGDAVQAGKDLVGKLPSSSDVTGAGRIKPCPTLAPAERARPAGMWLARRSATWAA